MSTWLVLVLLALVSVALRGVMVVAVGDRSLPAWLRDAAALAAPAVVVALLVSSVATNLVGDAAVAMPRLAALAAAVLVAARGGSAGLGLLGGCGAYVAVGLLAGAW